MIDWSRLITPTEVVPESNGTEQAEQAEPAKPAEPQTIKLSFEQPAIFKGQPVQVLTNRSYNSLSDTSVDCRAYNAVHVDVYVNGTNPSATISLEGGQAEGGNYVPLPDPNASQSSVSSNLSFDAVVGSGWVKVRVADISGTFGSGQGYTVVITPFVAPGIAEFASRTVTLAPLAARTTNDTGTTFSGLDRYRRWVVLLNITASATDAADTLDVYVDVSLDGTVWLNAIHFTQQAGNGSARKEFAVLDPANPGTATVDVTSDAAAGVVRPALWGPYMRARWAIVDAGTPGDQSHTFSVVAVGQD